MPKISEERKAATRKRLVDAAMVVLHQEGSTAMTTRRILEVADLSAGALYHYFASKDDLYEAIAEGFAGMDVWIEEAGEDAVEAHARSIEDMFGPRNHTILGRLRAEALDNSTVAEVMSRYDRRIVEKYGELNSRSIERGLFRRDLDAEALVEFLAIFHEGFALRAATGFATDRHRVLAVLAQAIREVALDDEHPDADELVRRIQKVVKE